MIMFIKDIVIRNKLFAKTAVIYKDIGHTYNELYTDCNYIANRLEVTCGNIAIILPNSYDFVVAFFSIAFMDKIAVPISVTSSKGELLNILKYCDISLIITNSTYFETLRKSIEDFENYLDIYLIDKDEVVKGNIPEKNSYVSITTDESSAFLLVHTSGSLSNPKRVMLSHENLISNASSIIKSLELSSNDVTIIAMPMFLISAITSQMITHLLLGATIVILELPFISNSFCNECKKYSVTNFTCVPAILNLLTLRNPMLNSINTLEKICFGGAPTPKKRIVELIEQFPKIKFIQMYGQTEASARLTHLLSKDFSNNIGSVGKPIPNVELKVINDIDNSECAPMVVGEICAKGKNIMMGYYKDLQLTEKTLINGWLHTGDLGYCDYNGFYYIVGRKRNVIISGGINIYPEEIEEVLLSHNNIIDALVYGDYDRILGEIVCANVVVKGHMNTSDILLHCNNTLSSYKIPKKINICEKINKTPTGKVRR